MEFQTSRLEPVSLICVSGKFRGDDNAFRRNLESEINGVLTAGCKRVLLNLDVEWLNSTCLGLLFREDSRIRSNGGRLAIYSHRERMHGIFRTIKPGWLQILFDSEEAALCYVVYGATGTWIPSDRLTRG